MDKDFRDRLSFSDAKDSFSKRENWREALTLLPQTTVQPTPIWLSNLPSMPDAANKAAHLQWEIAAESHATCVILVPYVVDDTTTYRVPSFSHLLSHLDLSGFDHAWVMFFAEHFYHDDAKVVLDTEESIHAILWALTRAKRLRLIAEDNVLHIEQPLQLKARLRYSDEWALWILDAELVMPSGELITPDAVDFITRSGLVIYNGTLFPLPKGAAWVVQLLESGAWYIANDYLGEALYQLSHRIHDAEFLDQLPQINRLQRMPLPVVYLRSKQFDKQTDVTLYLAYRYADCEVFSVWHSQEEAHLPIGFEANNESCVLYFRDLNRETAAESLIKNEASLTFIATKRAWLVSIAALWQLIHTLLREGWEVWAEKHKIEELSSFGIAAESGAGWFELQALDTKTKQVIDPIQLIKYLKRKALFIQLGHGKIGVLPERWITHLTQFLDIGHAEEDSGWRFSSIYAAAVDDLINDEVGFEADQTFQTTVDKMRSFGEITPLEQPEGLRALLRPYQLDGLTWLNLLCELHVGGILADDMGLGKTVQILALLQHRIVNQPHTNPQTILIVCPKSVQGHWLAQLNNLTPRLPSRILHPRDVVTGKIQRTQHQVLLASYGLIRHHIQALSEISFDILILDEAQMIKNEYSQTTQAIKQLNATQLFALTGTPIENRFEELESIFTFLNPLAQLSLGPSASSAEALRELVQRALHPFVLRRLKEDVLPDLPPKIIEEITLPMAADQKRLYQELLEVYRNEIAKHQHDNDLPTEADAAFFLEGLLRLRQVATHPQQLLAENFKTCSSNKRIYLREHLPYLIENNHRIVVFSQFLGFLKDLAHDMSELHIRYSYVDGETLDREREIAAFQSNQTIKVLLISLRVGGVGIDLTNADTCIIADPWWNDAVEKQAIDRLHRFGQKKMVTVLRLISADSIEEKMDILKRNKSALADAIGKTNPDFLTHLKWQDFTEIF